MNRCGSEYIVDEQNQTEDFCENSLALSLGVSHLSLEIYHILEEDKQICISCPENFVFIVEPPTADVCIGGRFVWTPTSIHIGQQMKEIFPVGGLRLNG